MNYSKKVNMGTDFSLALFKKLGIPLDETKAKSFEDTLTDEKDKISRLPKKKILSLIASADSLSESMASVEPEKITLENILPETSKAEPNLQELIKKGETELEEKAIEQGLSVDNYFNNVMTGFWPLLSQLPKMMTYGIILYAHENSTRYFDGIITPDDYFTHHLGIANKRVLNALKEGTKNMLDSIKSD